ncbi:hypothetical protein BJY04DRAFT_118969 [Aspergillus karnatakaensis]|uniref:uncharacterized protein n=1 Tax=Aspergillus karnatakaensis TaxID=1810916 RepID=UPI003CCD41B7
MALSRVRKGGATDNKPLYKWRRAKKSKSKWSKVHHRDDSESDRGETIALGGPGLDQCAEIIGLCEGCCRRVREMKPRIRPLNLCLRLYLHLLGVAGVAPSPFSLPVIMID